MIERHRPAPSHEADRWYDRFQAEREAHDATRADLYAMTDMRDRLAVHSLWLRLHPWTSALGLVATDLGDRAMLARDWWGDMGREDRAMVGLAVFAVAVALAASWATGAGR